MGPQLYLFYLLPDGRCHSRCGLCKHTDRLQQAMCYQMPWILCRDAMTAWTSIIETVRKHEESSS